MVICSEYMKDLFIVKLLSDKQPKCYVHGLPMGTIIGSCYDVRISSIFKCRLETTVEKKEYFFMSH